MLDNNSVNALLFKGRAVKDQRIYSAKLLLATEKLYVGLWKHTAQHHKGLRRKSYILADALGYDPSYLSKWLNNSKRPPAAMIDGTAEEIAKVCVHSGDTSAFEKLAENYNIQSVDVSDKTACKK